MDGHCISTDQQVFNFAVGERGGYARGIERARARRGVEAGEGVEQFSQAVFVGRGHPGRLRGSMSSMRVDPGYAVGGPDL